LSCSSPANGTTSSFLDQQTKPATLSHSSTSYISSTSSRDQTLSRLSTSRSPSDISLPTDLLSISRSTVTRSDTFFKMDQIQTHPANAAQAKTFIAPGSLSFPGGAGELTPPSSEADKQNGQRNGQMNGGQQQGAQGQNGNGVTPATPAATPGATQGVSGIVPTLQYV
jgi:hypothetical protein